MNFAVLSIPKDSGTFVLLAGLAVFLMLYVIIRPLMRRKNDPLKHTPIATSLSKQRTVERQMETLLVELSNMARQMTGQLDTRSAKLEILLKDADETIARLKTAAQDAAIAAPVFRPSVRADDAPPQYPALVTDPPAASAPPQPPVERIDPQHLKIYDLADAGQSISDIARALSRPSGEIELILALRRKRA